MIKTLLAPFASAADKTSASMAAMMVTSHDINFVASFLRSEGRVSKNKFDVRLFLSCSHYNNKNKTKAKNKRKIKKFFLFSFRSIHSGLQHAPALEFLP